MQAKTSQKQIHNCPTVAVETDPEQVARSAGLKYVSDNVPGIQRKRVGRGFRYINVDRQPIKQSQQLKRIKALVIPPSWQEVWICPFSNGHLQATGRDAKGRKQYRYHSKWQEVRNRTKFDRMIIFGHKLPAIRQATDRDLRSPNLSRERILATVVRLLEDTLIRIGNAEYAKKNKSFGLTTLRNSHVEVTTTKVRFQFRGKSGVEHEVELSDRRLARVIKRCQEIPGQELFQYLDQEGNPQAIDSADVNAYLQEITGEEFTAKDFRTWAGTANTAWALANLETPTTKKQTQTNIREAVKQVASQLGNRVATCRKYYIHPAIVQAYEEGWLLPMLKAEQEKFANHEVGELDLQPEELALLAVLEHHSTN
ncbi:MAG: DNA topoisomerase IB [Elainellaceae cyanobacterium]